MRISSQENITLIMDILNEVILSNGNVDMVPNIKNFVIERCSYYHKNRLNYKNIQEVNKFIMRDGYNYMQKLSVKNKNPNNAVKKGIAARQSNVIAAVVLVIE